jgi:amidase
VKRRDFFRAGIAGGLIVGGPKPRLFSPSPDAPAWPRAQAFELDEATVATLQDGIRSGRWTARRLAELYLERIEALDRRGPTLRAIIETNPDALTIADQLDDERRQGKLRGPLHGIPIVIKDNIDTGDRMQTTAGSLALVGRPAPRDAFIVERLRAAGLVLLGKTNLSEWANFRSSNSSSGWSGRGGQVRNPYVLDRSPCGSSAGSGAAGAACLAALTIGTETNGSIVCPSSLNSLVGVKPTVGLWSRSGIIPISATQDTAGPMCRTVTDAAHLLGALTGVDPRDPATGASQGKTAPDYTKGLEPGALRGVRLGVARKGFGFGPKMAPVFDEALRALKAAGAVLVDPADLPEIDEKYGKDEFEVLVSEFKDGVEKYLAARGNTVTPKTLADLIAFNDQHRDQEMPWFGQETFLEAQKRGPLTDPKYREAHRRILSIARGNFNGLIARHRLDAIVCMTTGPAWPIDLVNGDRFTGGSASYPAVAGYPHVTLPGGHVDGLPVGFSFMGPAWSEARLLRYAYAFEQATKVRVPPKFAPSIPA